MSSLKSRIPEIVVAMEPAVQATIAESVGAMASEAASNAPDAPPAFTGLPESIEAKEAQDGHGIYAAWYWHFPEFGTVRQAAHPYLIPAVEHEVPSMLAKLRGVLGHL